MRGGTAGRESLPACPDPADRLAPGMLGPSLPTGMPFPAAPCRRTLFFEGGRTPSGLRPWERQIAERLDLLVWGA
jgi:hypothetical protein